MSWHDAFVEILRQNVSLREHTSLRVGGTARWFLTPRTGREVAACVSLLAREGIPYRVLGGGTNLLIEDGRHDEPILHLGALDAVEFDGSGARAGAGASLQRLVNDAVERGLGGAEVITGIPGTLGGAVAMNAGGRHGELKDVFAWTKVALPDGRVERLGPTDVAFRYRKADLPQGAVVLEVALRLTPVDRHLLKQRAGEILKAKARTQPLRTPNAGCIFKNPPAGSAGALIDRSGLKGERCGDAVVSEMHANFIVNEGRAGSADILRLIERVQALVLERAGVPLEREIHVWRATVPEEANATRAQDLGVTSG